MVGTRWFGTRPGSRGRVSRVDDTYPLGAERFAGVFGETHLRAEQFASVVSMQVAPR